MAEPQYSTHFSIPRHKLGVMANQRWNDDPKLLGITLSRYKFVSKLLAGKKFVAEIGAGDAWFSRVVKKEVGKLDLYDFDVELINDHNDRGGITMFHDMLVAPLPHKYEAAYSLDVLEHISLDRQDIFLNNICASLQQDGVFICGVPSLESQPYASPASKIGHIGCMTYAEFKDRLKAHFDNVFVFTLHDEQLGLSFEKMAGYYLAVACGVR